MLVIWLCRQKIRHEGPGNKTKKRPKDETHACDSVPTLQTRNGLGLNIFSDSGLRVN